MEILTVGKHETNTTFSGSVDRYDVGNNGNIQILASTPRGKRVLLQLEEWEVSELVKQLKHRGLL